MGEIGQLLPSLAVPGSAIGALVIGIVALLRIRSTDRDALSTSQRNYIEMVEKAREAADARTEKFIQASDEERSRRIEAEQALAASEAARGELQRQVERLQNLLQQSSPPHGQA